MQAPSGMIDIPGNTVVKLFAMIDELSRETGNAPHYLRVYFETQYGPVIQGEHGPMPKPMSAYSREEASAMIERVYKEAGEMEVSLS